MFTGIWTPKNEHWFQTRLQEIRRGEAGPMNVRRWRSAIAQYRPCGRLADIVDAHSRQVLEQHL